MASTHSLDLELSSAQYAYINNANQIGLGLTGDFTIEASIMMEQFPSQSGLPFMIVSKNSSNDNQRAYQFFISTDNKIYCDFYQDGAANAWTRFHTDEAFSGDDIYNWFDISVTVDVSVPSMTFRKNGVIKTCSPDNTTATNINNSAAPFVIGGRLNAGSPQHLFDGFIKEVRVWNDIRTDQELEQNRGKEIDQNSQGLVGYWKFNNNYNDSTSNNNHLIAINAPVFTTIVPFAEAQNGWIELQPAGNIARSWSYIKADEDGSHLFAANANGRLYTSNDFGTTWIERQPAGNINKEWYGVYASGDGSFLIAGAWPGRLYVSFNGGQTWLERQPKGNVDGNWTKSACDADGSHLIAADNGGRLWTSTNSGVSWTERRPAGNMDKTWYPVAINQDGSVMMAAVIGGRLYVSTDAGVTWIERQPAGNIDKYWKAMACSSTGQYMIVGDYLAGRLYTSSDFGVTWTERQPGGNVNRYWARASMSYDGSKIIVSDYGQGTAGSRIWYSEDFGVTWVELQPNGNINRTWTGVAITGNGTRKFAGYFYGRLYAEPLETLPPPPPPTGLTITINGVPYDITSVTGHLDFVTQ